MNAVLLEPWTERFREPNTPFLSPGKVGELFGLRVQELAERAHVHRNTPTARPHAAQLQKYLQDMVRLLAVATAMTGDEGRAVFLLRNEPLRAFRRVLQIAGSAPKPRKTEPVTFLFTLDGEHVPAKAVGTQYGMKWLIEAVEGENAWVPYMPARPSTLTKYGYMEVEGLAWADDDVPQLNPPIEVAC